MSHQNNVYPIDLLAVQIMCGQKAYYDGSLYYNAKMTIAIDSLPFVAKAVVDVIKAMEGRLKKCVICDLDNTLWGGVIGDDGVGGIENGELGKGHAFLDLQRWLRQLKEYGTILVVCSKNTKSVAKELLKRMIQESLNIGMDSIVFLDDNPFERELLK